jgi:hypothetical protein
MAHRRQARFVPDVDLAGAIIDLSHVPANAVFELGSDPANLFATVNPLGVADQLWRQSLRQRQFSDEGVRIFACLPSITSR